MNDASPIVNFGSAKQDFRVYHESASADSMVAG